MGSLASMTLVGEMWYEAFGMVVWWEVIRLCHVNVFISHSGARCLRSVLEYSRSLQLCRTSLSYSFVPGCSCSVLRFSCLVWSIVLDAHRMMVAMSLYWCILGRFSNSNSNSVDARRRMRSVGSLRWLVSRASEGQLYLSIYLSI